MTVPTTAAFCAKASSSADQSRGWADLETREVVVALFVAALDGDEDLVARLDTFGVVLESGERGGRLLFCSRCRRKTCSAERKRLVPSICFAPEAGLWVWLRSNCERMSAKFSWGSTGSSAGLADGLCSRNCSFRRVSGNTRCGRSRLLAGGFGRFGGGLGLWNAFVAHDVYCSIVPCFGGRSVRPCTMGIPRLWRDAMRRDVGGAAFVVDHVGDFAVIVEGDGDHVVEANTGCDGNLDGAREQ